MPPDEPGGLATCGGPQSLAAVAERSPGYPAVPTMRELGYDVVANNTKGWVGPAGMTDEMTAYLHDRVREGMRTANPARFAGRPGESARPGLRRATDTLPGFTRAAPGPR